MDDKTYQSPTIIVEPLPSEGIEVVPPREPSQEQTVYPPVIPDKALPDFDNNILKSGGFDQIINGVLKIGTHITIDGVNKRILINDGHVNRILIGRYPD